MKYGGRKRSTHVIFEVLTGTDIAEQFPRDVCERAFLGRWDPPGPCGQLRRPRQAQGLAVAGPGRHGGRQQPTSCSSTRCCGSVRRLLKAEGLASVPRGKKVRTTVAEPVTSGRLICVIGTSPPKPRTAVGSPTSPTSPSWSTSSPSDRGMGCGHQQAHPARARRTRHGPLAPRPRDARKFRVCENSRWSRIGRLKGIFSC